MSFYQFLADVVVVAHGAYVAFVVFGMLAILLGIALRWQCVRNFWFRILHFVAIGIVAVQALLGALCPLTRLENYLRVQGGEATYSGSFIGYWVHQVIFYDFPSWVFTTTYCLFGAAVLATLLLAPPRWPRSEDRPGSRPPV